MTKVSLPGFRATFEALFVLNYWSKEFPLSAVANHFESLCESNTIDAIVLLNLPLLSYTVPAEITFEVFLDSPKTKCMCHWKQGLLR